MNHHRASTVIAWAIVLSAFTALWATFAAIVNASPPVQSCSTPAANFSTLTTCRTQTARAGAATATTRATASATPTKVTPVPTLTELIVFVKVFIKFGDNQSVDSGIFPWRASQPVSCQLIRIDNFPQPTVTRLP